MSARPRMLVFAASIAAAAGVLAGSLGFCAEEARTPTLESGAAEAPRLREMARATAGVPQHENRIGRPGASLRIVVYEDLGCRPCARATHTALPGLVRRWVRPGAATLTFRPVAVLGRESRRRAQAALAAAEQGRMWPFLALLRRRPPREGPGALGDARMHRVARALRLDLADFERSSHGTGTAEPVRWDTLRVVRRGARALPMLAMRGPLGVRVLEAPSPRALEAAIAAVGGLR